MQWVNLLQHQKPYKGWGQTLAAPPTSHPASCSCSWKAIEDGLCTWAPYTHVKDSDGVPGSWIYCFCVHSAFQISKCFTIKRNAKHVAKTFVKFHSCYSLKTGLNDTAILWISSLTCFVVLGCKFKSLIHFVLILVYGKRQGSNFIIQHVDIHFFSTIY